MHPQQTAASRDAECHRGKGRLPAEIDLEAENIAEKALVRSRQQQGMAEYGEALRGPQQLERLLGRLAEVETCVDYHALRGNAGVDGASGQVGQPVANLDDDVAVHRLGIGHAGARRMWVATTLALAAAATSR